MSDYSKVMPYLTHEQINEVMREYSDAVGNLHSAPRGWRQATADRYNVPRWVIRWITRRYREEMRAEERELV